MEDEVPNKLKFTKRSIKTLAPDPELRKVYSDTETVAGSATYPVTVPYRVSITNSSSSDAIIPLGGITDDTHDISGLVCTRTDSSTFVLGDLPQPIAAGETIG